MQSLDEHMKPAQEQDGYLEGCREALYAAFDDLVEALAYPNEGRMSGSRAESLALDQAKNLLDDMVGDFAEQFKVCHGNNRYCSR